MTLPEELRQASRYTALDHHRDLLERAAAEIERYRDLLEAALDATLSTQGEKT